MICKRVELLPNVHHWNKEKWGRKDRKAAVKDDHPPILPLRLLEDSLSEVI